MSGKTRTSSSSAPPAACDRDGYGLPRLVLYDYGPGDTVTIPCGAVVRRQE